MKEALKNDRARIQIGRISSFGLLEMSRQRLHPSLAEASTEICPHCAGTGRIRSVDSTALHVLRMVEEEITRSYSPGVVVMVPGAVALYILNQKRGALSDLEHRRGVRIYLEADESLIPPDYRLERIKLLAPGEEVQQRQLPPITVVEEEFEVEDEIEVDEDDADVAGETDDAEEATTGDAAGQSGEARGRKRRRRRRTGRGERLRADEFTEATEGAPAVEGGEQPRATPAPAANDEGGAGGADDDDDGHDDGDEDEGEVAADGDGDQPRRRRRRGRRGGRRRSRRPQDEVAGEGGDGDSPAEDGNRAEAGPSGDTVHQAWTAGEGDQPSLPDILPVHWQQQSPTLTNAETAPDSSAAATSTITGETTAEAAAQPGGNDAATADQGNTRRRTRRDDGERPARIRKPRRSRDEIAGDAASAEATVQGNAGQSNAGQSNSEPVEAPVEHARPAVARPSEPTPAEPIQSAPIPLAAIEPASPQFVPSQPSPAADVSGNNGAGTAGDVTVIGEGTSSEDGPKRRGWWRRLME
jgi:ribonuclease E